MLKTVDISNPVKFNLFSVNSMLILFCEFTTVKKTAQGVFSLCISLSNYAFQTCIYITELISSSFLEEATMFLGTRKDKIVKAIIVLSKAMQNDLFFIKF